MNSNISKQTFRGQKATDRLRILGIDKKDQRLFEVTVCVTARASD